MLVGDAKIKREELASKQVNMLSTVANNGASTMELLKDVRNQHRQKADVPIIDHGKLHGGGTVCQGAVSEVSILIGGAGHAFWRLWMT